MRANPLAAAYTCALPAALCKNLWSEIVRRTHCTHTNPRLQGFGKAKNRVGMPRPKKRKVEELEMFDEQAEKIENEQGDAELWRRAPRPQISHIGMTALMN